MTPKPTTGMLLDGVFSAEVVDSSAEVVDIKGMDISSLEAGDGSINAEHLSEATSKIPGMETIGKIVFAKKVYSAADCDDDRQREYWAGVKVPFLYGVARLYDGAGHAGAQAFAAQIRDQVANGEPINVRFSVEGSSLERDGNRITSSVVRRVSVTLKPANKAAVSGVIADPNAPEGFPEVAKAEGFDRLSSTEGRAGVVTDFELDPVLKLVSAATVLSAVRKALTAGSGDVAPSARTGGAALQREDFKSRVTGLIKDFQGPFSREAFKAFAKTRLPEASDDYLDYFADAAEALSVRRDLLKALPGVSRKVAPKTSAPRLARAPEVDEEEAAAAESGNMVAGSQRGRVLEPQLVRSATFDAKKGVLTTPVGQFRAYLPKHDGPESEAFYKKTLESPQVSDPHDKAMEQWVKVHKLAKSGRLPPEVVMHAVMFSQLCLDAETEALTQRGWIKGFNLTEHDILLTKNADTNALEWQHIEALRLYPDYDGPVLEFKSKSFHAVTTPAHRWLVTTQRGVVREKSTLEITENDQIHRTGDYRPVIKSALTPDEAELLGWFVTDGHYYKSKACNGVYINDGRAKYEVPGTYARLNQSTIGNPEKCERIDTLLGRLGIERPGVVAKDGKEVWTLGPKLTAMLLREAPDRCLTIATLLKLDRPSLDRLREAMILGDGTHWQGKPGWKPSERLATGRKEQADAFQVLLCLTGSSSAQGERDLSKYQREERYASMSNVPKLGIIHEVRTHHREFARVERGQISVHTGPNPVWCPQVKNSFFVVRRSNVVYITGNSPNKPVPVQELQYARLVDAMHLTGLDPSRPGFGAVEGVMRGMDLPGVYPETGREHFETGKQYHLGQQIGVKTDASGQKVGKPAASGRYPGELKTVNPLLNDAFSRLNRYHEIHDAVVGLVNKHRHNMLGAAGELMDSKQQAANWANVRRRHLEEGKPDPGEFQGLEVPGLKVKTGLYTLGMLGGSNSFVPDTHFIRHFFGLDPDMDRQSIAYLKNAVWRPTALAPGANGEPSMIGAMNQWYARNHPTVRHMLDHPKWGSHFETPDDALFPAFWKHWLTIAPHEKHLGLTNRAAQEATTHGPFWDAIRPFVDTAKSEAGFDSSLPLRTAEVHLAAMEHFGEVPALMMYYAHLVPHLLAAAEHRERTAQGLEFLAKVRRAEAGVVELRKDLREAAHGSGVDFPEVHRVELVINGRRHPAGRFMLHNGKLEHLEDYHGVLEGLLPEGPLNAAAVARLHGAKWSPHFEVSSAPVGVPEVSVATSPAPVPRRPAVFDYHRPGMLRPHVLERGPRGWALDGSALSPAEVGLIRRNAESGVATLKWRQGAEAMAKAEEVMDPGDALQHVRAAVAAGHVHPDVAAALTRHIMEDPMVPSIGNKYAATKFLAQGKPGVYISSDSNDLKATNDTLGHEAGDQAIKSTFGALRAAADKVGGVKVFRSGGDEGLVWAPTYEHAARFVREAHQHLDAVPPIGGVHKLSISMGLGHNFGDADKALYEAKKRKVDPVTGQRAFPIGHVPHLTHSNVPGTEVAGQHSTPGASQTSLPTVGKTI